MKKYFYSPEYKKFILWFWILFLIFILLFGLFVYSVSAGWMGSLPKIEDLENPKSDLATEVLSEDGKYSSRNGYRSANIGFTGNSAAFGMEDAF